MPKSDKLAEVEIPPEDFSNVIAEVSEAHPPNVSRFTNWLFKNEVLALLFGEKFQGWFQGVRQVFTILFVPALFVVTLFWLGFIGYLIWWAAFHKELFGLSDAVLIALITTTTATVLGLFHYANRWLFDHPSKSPNDPPNSN